MKVYKILSRINLIRQNYALKFFVAMLPLLLLCLVLLVLLGLVQAGNIYIPVPVIFITGFVLIALSTILIISLFKKLLSPLTLAETALDNYTKDRLIPELPVEYGDEAGILLSKIQAAIGKLDGLITEKSDMIDLLSHDLRSPVGRILGLSNIIKTANDEEKVLYADYISNECSGLLSMLENILLMLKEDSTVFRLEHVNLKKMILETVSFFHFPIAEKNLVLNVNINESIYVYVQQSLFVQAIRNLLGNAIKFSPEGKVIDITGAEETDKIAIVLKDQGLGFNPMDIQKIFDRFTTAGKKGTHGEHSTGLGLYLSKKIIEKHNGKLLADSKGINTGAAFTIILYKLITKKPQDRVFKKDVKKTIAFRSR